MIWALLAWFLFGASSSGQNALMLDSEGVDNLTSSIEVVVDDEARKLSAMETVKALKADIREFERVFVDSGRQLNRLATNHEDTSGEINAVLADLNTTWEAGQVQALNARFQLREILTEDEWKVLFGMDAASTGQ